jgi:putative ABC transport system permease protein
MARLGGKVMREDFHYAVRRLFRRPGFTVPALFALALGIACTTAIFSVIEAVLLRPLPFPESQNIASLWDDQPGYPDGSMSGPDFRDLRASAQAFESVSAFREMRFRLTGLDEPQAVLGTQTDGDFFRVLQATPIAGRLYSGGAGGEVVLSEGLWRKSFGAERSAIGKTLSLNGEPRTIVGVVAAGTEVPQRSELWVSSVRDLPVLPGYAEGLTERDARYLKGIGRLRTGVSMAQAQAVLDTLSSRLAAAYPSSNQGHRFRAEDLHARMVGSARKPLLLLVVGVLLVLLIACANVSGLQLARGAASERDLAIRAALGASRGRLVRQLLVESTVLSIAGGVLGVVAALWGLKLLLGLAAASLPRSGSIRLDGAALAFAVVLSAAAGIFSGLVPAVLASRPAVIAALRGGTPTPSQFRLRSVLVTAEVALSVVLLAGAALLIRSFERINAVDPGFRAGGVVVLPLSHAEAGAAQFHEEAVRRVAGMQGVEAAGAIFSLPMAGGLMAGDITPEGRPPHEGDYISATEIVAGDYFRAMGIPILQGRALSARDTRTSQPVAVVNQTFARTFFGGDALGKRFCYSVADKNTTVWFTIVGIARDVRQINLAREALPEAYYPIEQAPAPPVDMTIVARTNLPLGAFVRAVRSEIDPEQPVTTAHLFEDTVSATLHDRRLSTVLLSIFSVCALLLSVLGIYAMLAYSVAQRTREIGIRMALGARESSVVGLVIFQGMRLALAGAVLGLLGALGMERFLAGLLFEVAPHDPAMLATAAIALLVPALLACFIPARRAARVDPQIALRAE